MECQMALHFFLPLVSLNIDFNMTTENFSITVVNAPPLLSQKTPRQNSPIAEK